MNAGRLLFLSFLFVLGLSFRHSPVQGDGRSNLDGELLTPAGELAVFTGRTLDLKLSRDKKTLYLKEHNGIRAIDIANWKEIAHLAGAGSLTGLELSPDGMYLLSTDTGSGISVYKLQSDGKPVLDRTIKLAAKTVFPCGLRFRRDGKSILVCLSLANKLAEVEWPSGRVLHTTPTGIAPYEVEISGDNTRAYVSCQGGRRPKTGEKSEESGGTAVPVDERGVTKTGVVSLIDLKAHRLKKDIAVGLQPSALTWLSATGLVVANANSDSISIIDTKTNVPARTVIVKPDPNLPFGSMPNGLCLADGRLYVALAGNNSVAVYDAKTTAPIGLIPTAWYPGAVASDGKDLFVANVKGVGSVAKAREEEKGHNSWDLTGAVQKVPLTFDLAAGRRIVLGNSRVPQTLRGQERARVAARKPVPVPAKVGDPSVLEHVIYVIKENRTYDQVFGDMERGERDPKLCVFGEKVTPNHHALAREFVLLDNYFCNGVCSADGHAWAIEGNVTPYLEREFGGFSRSYDYGTDPITFSSSGFLWDPILAKGLSFRNFGEIDLAEVPKGWKPQGVWRNFEAMKDTIFDQRIEIEKLRRYSCREYPGWNMAIPDVLRMDRFLKEFKVWEATGLMPNLIILYLPQDHTAGTTPNYPTTASYVADNDLAVGQLVDAVSHSKFWKSTVIFANEDDPQNGYDHVDGNRSLCLVASPYAKRGQTVSKFYNQNSVLRTILRIFGLPALNQKMAEAPLMTDCFTSTADLTPFTAIDPQIDLNKTNPALASLKGKERYWAEQSMKLKFRSPDFPTARLDDLFGRIVWHSRKGVNAPYPSKWVGAHGKGLKARKLRHDKMVDDD